MELSPEATRLLALFAWLENPASMKHAAQATAMTIEQLELAQGELLTRGFIQPLARTN